MPGDNLVTDQRDDRPTVPLLWAKTKKLQGDGISDAWHPLLLHCLDVAACAMSILLREPESVRQRIANVFDLSWCDADPWLMLIIASHDVGKACPGFQCKWQNLSGLNPGRSPNTKINHAYVSQIALCYWLIDEGWPAEMARLVSDAVGCHHGSRASPRELEHLEGDRSALGDTPWTEARTSLLDALYKLFKPGSCPNKPTLAGPDFMLLAGLTSFADWIGSSETWFPYAPADAVVNPEAWFTERRGCAERALDAIGWARRLPLSDKPRDFADVFGFAPRPLQEAVAGALKHVQAPAIFLIEAPMGEGKTEAAFFAHLELQRLFGHRGLYIALPTQATGNAMFERTLAFLQDQGGERTLDMQLLHGGTLLNDTFQNLLLAGIHDEQAKGTGSAEVRAGEWFTHKKRALLSEYGVGTVDQALLPILPVRHQFVRLWGLADRVVVFDEIHAYDAYTGTLLIHLLRWLLALGSSIVLLSATLPPVIRRKLAKVVSAPLPEQEANYPRLSVFQPGSVIQQHFAADPARRRSLTLQRVGANVADIQAGLQTHLATGGMALALVNTVQRAQMLYQAYGDGEPLQLDGHRVGKRLADGTEVALFHARFPAEQRRVREAHALSTFGKSSGDGGHRCGRRILIATQVVEQSLDLDFDVIATDLAPVDLLLQRAGRLWRHERGVRPMPVPVLLVAGLAEETPPEFGAPLWWKAVYREDVLLRTWNLLRGREQLTLPDDIDPLVQAVYEEQVDLPPFLLERLERAQLETDGNTLADTGQAHLAVIGLPDDSSWDDPARFVLYDEDEPCVHRTLAAKTRLGKESAVLIPLWPHDRFNEHTPPEFQQAKTWYLRALRVSRLGIVKKLQALGVPQGWQQSPLLRNAFPLHLDEQDCWLHDEKVCLDVELGLIYEPIPLNEEIE